MMMLTPQSSRIDLTELKLQIGKKIGPDRAKHYFGYLNSFLGQKLSKPEFNKLCFIILGRENIPLHNQLVCSIIKNAFQAKVPPPLVSEKDGVKPIEGAAGKKFTSVDDGFHLSPSMVYTPTNWYNGVSVPPTSRKCRSIIQDRRSKDRCSTLGPNGKIEAIAHQRSTPSHITNMRENGSLVHCDLKRPTLKAQADMVEQPTKRQRIEKPSSHEQGSVHTKSSKDVVAVEDGEELEHIYDANSGRGPLKAPVGIPFCPASVGGACRPLPLTTNASSSSFISNCSSGELCHTEVLKKRMEHIVASQGLSDVTADSANALNMALDVYLKHLIKSCVDLVGARLGHELVGHSGHKQHHHGKIINGLRPENHMHVKGSFRSLEGSESKNRISLLDFKVAMELNPQQLGEDWTLLLEKICLRSFEE